MSVHLGSSELRKAYDEYMRKPRCYREMKLCPNDGCDCEGQRLRSRIEEEPSGDDEVSAEHQTASLTQNNPIIKAP